VKWQYFPVFGTFFMVIMTAQSGAAVPPPSGGSCMSAWAVLILKSEEFGQTGAFF
jgi:hypothetical protein